MFKNNNFLIYGFVQLFIFSLPIIAHGLSDNTLYQELNEWVFLLLAFILAFGLAYLQIFIMQKEFPALYACYQEWTRKGKDHSTIYFFLTTLGYFNSLFIMSLYYDQYHVTTPIKGYPFTAVSHYKTHHRKSGTSYNVVFMSPLFGKYETSDSVGDFYNTVEAGDIMNLFLREGRFHTHFVIDSQFNKAPQNTDQNYLKQYIFSSLKIQGKAMEWNKILNFHSSNY